MSAIEQAIEYFEAEIAAARKHLETRHSGGMNLPFMGDFAGIPPSRLNRLSWWAMTFRKAVEIDNEGDDEGT